MVLSILDRLLDLSQRIIGFLQETGIVFMILISLIGLMLFLLSGNSPIIKRAGIVTAIIFGLGSFGAAYIPVIMYYFTSDQRNREELLGVVAEDSVGNIYKLFDVLLDLSIPITITIILIGLMVRGLGANNPKKREKA